MGFYLEFPSQRVFLSWSVTGNDCILCSFALLRKEPIILIPNERRRPLLGLVLQNFISNLHSHANANAPRAESSSGSIFHSNFSSPLIASTKCESLDAVHVFNGVYALPPALIRNAEFSCKCVFAPRNKSQRNC